MTVSDHARPSDDRSRRLAAHLPRVRSLLYRISGSAQDLDDLTQEALIEIARALDSFEGRAKESTFVHAIAVRVAYRWLAARRRRRRELPILELVPPPADELDPESRAMARQALGRLYRVLDELSDPLRVAFILCELEGMEPREAAAIEGVAAGALRTRLSRAKDEVRRRLAQDPYVARIVARGGGDG